MGLFLWPKINLQPSTFNPLFYPYRSVLPTEAELERERRVIEQKQNGGDT